MTVYMVEKLNIAAESKGFPAGLKSTSQLQHYSLLHFDNLHVHKLLKPGSNFHLCSQHVPEDEYSIYRQNISSLRFPPDSF